MTRARRPRGTPHVLRGSTFARGRRRPPPVPIDPELPPLVVVRRPTPALPPAQTTRRPAAVDPPRVVLARRDLHRALAAHEDSEDVRDAQRLRGTFNRFSAEALAAREAFTVAEVALATLARVTASERAVLGAGTVSS